MIKRILSINWKRCPNTHEELSKMQWLAKSKLENSNNEPQMLDLYDNCWDARMYASMHKMKWLINNINNELLINKNKFGEW